MASWLVRSSPERAVRARALAEDAVLCSWARHLNLTVPLSTKEYKWVPANCWGKPNKLRGNDLRWTSIPSRGSRYTPSRFMLHKPRISYGSYDPVGSKASLTTIFFSSITCLVFKPARSEVMAVANLVQKISHHDSHIGGAKSYTNMAAPYW